MVYFPTAANAWSISAMMSSTSSKPTEKRKTWADMAAENGKDWREQVDEIVEILQYGDEHGLDMRKVVFGETERSTEPE